MHKRSEYNNIRSNGDGSVSMLAKKKKAFKIRLLRGRTNRIKAAEGRGKRIFVEEKGSEKSKKGEKEGEAESFAFKGRSGNEGNMSFTPFWDHASTDSEAWNDPMTQTSECIYRGVGKWLR